MPAEPNPAAIHQSKFRVVPKKSYSERMSETRAEIRRIMRDALREWPCTFSRILPLPSSLTTIAGHITQDENASMRWPSYWKDIVVKYRVAIVGWPYNEVPFRNLSDVSNLQKLEILLKGWQEGTIYFRHITDAEFAMMEAERASQLEVGL